MKLIMSVALVLSWCVALNSACAAAPAPQPQQEINYLLSFVGTSGCIFYRNGSAYTSRKAEVHLRSKYEDASAIDHIRTAEEFIVRIASFSSLSGRPYRVQCNSGAETATADWLTAALLRFRSERAADDGSRP